MGKKVLSILLMVVFCVTSLSACTINILSSSNSNVKSENTRVITDSLGREVAIPKTITKVIPTGQLAQIVLLSVCPDMMVALASEWDNCVKEFISSDVGELPVVGQLYGGKKDFNLESILAADPDIIIDVGDAKKGMIEDIDALQKQVGIPFVHLDGSLENLAQSYRLLGDILGRSEDANERAVYSEKMNEKLGKISSEINPIDALLITGPEGLNVIPDGSYQGEAFNMFANNLAVVEEPSSRGTGNEVDMEQILKWNPDVIIYLPETTDKSVFESETWQEVTAVKEGNIYHVPYGPYNWLGFPASIQRYLGMMWMVDTFYPEKSDVSLYDEAKEYYKLFYQYDLSEDKFEELIAQ